MLTIAGGIIVAFFAIIALVAAGSFISLCFEAAFFAIFSPKKKNY